MTLPLMRKSNFWTPCGVVLLGEMIRLGVIVSLNVLKALVPPQTQVNHQFGVCQADNLAKGRVCKNIQKIRQRVALRPETFLKSGIICEDFYRAFGRHRTCTNM